MPLRLLPLLFIGGHLQNVNVGWMCKASDARLKLYGGVQSVVDARHQPLAIRGSTIVPDCNSVKRRRRLERYGSVNCTCH